MELNEATRRIFGQHWRLIAAFIVGGLLVGLLVHSGGSRSYTASTRLALDTQDPKSQPESTAISDTADALATSPALVARALADSHVTGRDASKVAGKHVSTRSLGTSGILELSVSDRDPRVAAAVANALATRVIAVRLNVTRGTSEQAVGSLDQRISDLNRQISGLDAKIAALGVRAATTVDPVLANSYRAKRDTASTSRDFLTEQRTVFETERANVTSGAAMLPKPTVISPATPPSHPDSSGFSADIVLGLLLGAILGVGVAALIESIRPTIVGGEALAAKFDTPLLGALSDGPDGNPRLVDLVGIAERIRLAAGAAHVRTICLLAVGDGINVTRLASELDVFVRPAEADGNDEPAIAGARGQSAQHLRAAQAPRHVHRGGPVTRVRPFESRSFAMSNGHAGGRKRSDGNGSGVVLVCPPVLKQDALATARHLLRINPGGLLGLIEYTSGPRRRVPFDLDDWETE